MRRLLLACLALLVLLASGLAFARDVPVPPAPTRWVTDTAGLLSPGAAAALDARLREYEEQSGHQVVVWIGDSIDGAPLDDFAVRTFKSWQIGRKGQDDGVLLLVLKTDRKMAIEVGYGLEGRVPDAIAKRIIDDVMAPRLREGDADGALAAGVDAVLEAVEGHPVGARAPPPGRPPPGGHRPSNAELILMGLLALGFLILLVTHPSLALYLMFSILSGGGGGGGLGRDRGFSGGGGRSGGGGARGSW